MSADGRGRPELLSVVAPVFDERTAIETFYVRVCAALADHPFELVLVDDGSTDGTAEALAAIAAQDPRVLVVSLTRNFGHQAALTAGLDHARGNPVVMLDSDLQDPPELIPDMVQRWREGSDIVYAVRRRRAGERRFKLATAGLFYRLFRRLSSVDLPPDSGDFRLLDRHPLDALLSMRERARFLRGMTAWVGYTQTVVEYDRDPRLNGETKYTLPRMVALSFDAISSFSHLPLQLATWLGFVISAFAFACIPLIVVLRLAGSYLPGFGTITIAILGLGGIQLIALGIIGEYLSRIYDEVKGRPLYLVREPRGDDASDGGRFVRERQRDEV
ncbi:MAG: polyisoprenyl-phosphate glycosyltransferase [Solirubrobacteraceae bacterium]|jgi:dolichol-phosphate mannosyltransferase|nr:polyisoprenyl-phosphate glycosyltransferase [Solirubrobacteraceae bacterium]